MTFEAWRTENVAREWTVTLFYFILLTGLSQVDVIYYFVKLHG